MTVSRMAYLPPPLSFSFSFFIIFFILLSFLFDLMQGLGRVPLRITLCDGKRFNTPEYNAHPLKRPSGGGDPVDKTPVVQLL